MRGRPPAEPRRVRPAFWSSRSGMVTLMPRSVRNRRLAAEVYALSASTWSGRVRGRPGRPSLTRMPPTTVVNNDVSAALPAVSTRLSGLPLPSVARWIVQVIPPLDRPIAWSGGSDSPSFLSFHPAPCVALECRAVFVDPGDRGVHRDDPVDLSGRGRGGLDRGQDPRPGPVGRPGREALIDRVPVTEPLRHIPPRRAGSKPPRDSLHRRTHVHHRPPPALRLGKQRLQNRPRFISNLLPHHHEPTLAAPPPRIDYQHALGRPSHRPPAPFPHAGVGSSRQRRPRRHRDTHPRPPDHS